MHSISQVAGKTATAIYDDSYNHIRLSDSLKDGPEGKHDGRTSLIASMAPRFPTLFAGKKLETSVW